MIKFLISKVRGYLFSYRKRRILDTLELVRSNILRKLYLEACSMFPNNTLSENSAIASSLTDVLLGLKDSKISVNDEDMDILHNHASNDDLVMQDVANYHRVTAYNYSFSDSYKMLSGLIEEAMLKANSAVADSVILDKESIKDLFVNNNKEKRFLISRVKGSNKEKIEREKLEVINPVIITAAHFSTSLTLLSTLFLISGFVYVKSIFYFLGVDVGDFYNIQDYLSSSIDVISATAFSAFWGLFWFFYGLERLLNDEVCDGQFDIKEKRKSYLWPSILVVSCLGLAFSFYNTGRWPSLLIYPILFTLVMYAYFRMPLWKFIDNKKTVGAAILVVVFFFMHLGLRIKDDVENILLEGYKSIYLISLKSEYKEYSQMSYLASNSNFVFLFDVETKKVVVLPKSSVTSFKTNN